jgi:hypothetical protein
MADPFIVKASSAPIVRDADNELSPDALATISSAGSKDKKELRASVMEAASREMVSTPTSCEERMVAGTTVNGQMLFERDGHRFYYPNGDTKSNFVSVQQPDGSFKWTTKDAMLAPGGNGFRGNQPYQVGSIETLNGRLAAMYKFPDGRTAYFDGRDWHQKAIGEDTFKTVTGSRLAFRGAGGNEVIYAAPNSAVLSR